MKLTQNLRAGLGCVAIVAAGASILVWLSSCGTAPSAFIVRGPESTNNTVPSLQILEPAVNVTRGRGDNLLIRWSDSDIDSNADISFLLVNTETNVMTVLVNGLKENDTGIDSGPDSFTAGTSLVPLGEYYLQGLIDDGINPPVSTYAINNASNNQDRVVINIVEPGTQPPTNPPSIAVVAPSINLSVAQDDILRVTVQPSIQVPNENRPYDPDSDVTIYVLLDEDLNPNNDNPANPGSSAIILLRTANAVAGAFGALQFDIPIDLVMVPARPAGEPYYIRATIDDLTNPRVHSYAPGTMNVVGLAAGNVDMAEVGTTKSGAKIYGFNPGANLGYKATNIRDFDADGVADCVFIARYGNPRNTGPVGEAYLFYGQNGIRFGGAIAANSVSGNIPGIIFEGAPVRSSPDGVPLAGLDENLGITDASVISDLTGDGRPELLFGMPLVYGAVETMDYDPSDSDIDIDENTVEIEIVVQQGSITVQVGNDNPETTNPTYNGIDDTFVSSQFPNTSFGSEQELKWRNEGVGQREWTLIKFKDLLSEIPDDAQNIDIDGIEGSLELRVFRTGVDADIHQSLTDFTELTTYASYAENGGEPQPNVDYVVEGGMGIDMVSGEEATIVTIDVTMLVRQLLDRDLTEFDDELRFIIVPAVDEDNLGDTAVRSSEFSFDRPTLRINYTRANVGGAINCYPDNLVNNITTEEDGGSNDIYYFSGGMATVINSTNRDNAGIIDVNRLDNTSISLEMVGQRAGRVFDGEGINETGGDVLARADNENAEPAGFDDQTAGRIAGARFTSGGYDYIDGRVLRQGPRADLFGQFVASIGDLNNDNIDEIVISAPRNELYRTELLEANGLQSTHYASTLFFGSITVIPGGNYNALEWREKGDSESSTATIPMLDQHRVGPFGSCTNPLWPRHMLFPIDTFEVFAEDETDMLGNGQSAGDFNLDGVPDLLCGAYLNDRSDSLIDSGASYILYGRTVLGDYDLGNADDALLRSPMLRIRGAKVGDQIGWRQATGLDVNGDRIDDVFISSPRADYGNVNRTTCARDYDGNGSVSSSDLTVSRFNSCQNQFEEISPNEQLFSDAPCKAFDYDNDGDVDAEDRCVFCCLSEECDPESSCSYGLQAGNCCANIVDNGFVGVIFGGVFTDGDRSINQIATTDLPGTIFYGSGPNFRAGHDVSSAGDFNEDGFGDILIAVPGETRIDAAARERLGVVYLVFGGTHLYNTTWDLSQVGSVDLPGIVFMSPYVKGAPNEAAMTSVAFIGDINRDGFGDISIGLPDADFIDLSFPQGPDAPESDAGVGRRSNAGNAYIVYGNNFGTNRGSP